MEIRSNGFRVYLKSLGVEDAETIAQEINDPDVIENLANLGGIPFPYKKADALSFIEFATNAYAQMSEVHFGIHLVENNKLIGVLGFKNYDKTSKKAEIGYWIGKRHWRKGYGKEAIRLMIAYGFQKLELNRIFAIVFMFNEASSKLLESLKFKKEGILRENGIHKTGFVDDVILSLLKKEYNDDIKPEIRD